MLSLRPDSPSNASSSDDGGFIIRNRNRASWRRPLIAYPSQLSIRSDASGQSTSKFRLQIATITPKFQSSSPSSNLLLSPWSPLYFSDLSSVRYPSSGEKPYPTPPGFIQLKSVHERYSQELPSLRAIHEETQFIPVDPIRELPRVVPTANRRASRLLPPRHARLARSAPELDHLDRSPESRSSSSGFGSKNTSQQNQSSHSGSTFIDWRLPPYRPPPPVPPPPPPPPLVRHWLEFEHSHKAVDVGSVDGHYEFDPSSPTSTPTGSTGGTPRKSFGLRSRYDNIDARVQAMKEEFNEFRKRQANRRRSHELESAC